MSKYIDAEKLIASMADSDILDKKDIAEWVNCNTADVIPVIHGRWVWDENAHDWGLGAFICSECHCKNDNLPDNRYNPYMFTGSRYCPNCGAKMDGKDGE